MSRNDNSLYTGMTSSASRRLEEKKKRASEIKQSDRAKLSPSAELITAEINKAREEIAAEIVNIIHMDMEKDNVKATVLGLRLADAKILSLKARLLNLLRTGGKNE